MTFQKILCPIDFSAGSRQAMHVAVRLAKETGAELVVFHAWYMPYAFSGEYFLPGDLVQELCDDARRLLDTEVQEATALGAKRVTSQLATGMPRYEITRVLEQDPAFDLVVIGTHGRTGLQRVLLGSVAESTVRHAPCSVLVVRPDIAIAPFRQVLCLTDFSESSRHAAELAASLAQPESPGITLLHVIEPAFGYEHRQPLVDFLRDLDKRTTECLDAWIAELELKAAAPVRRLCRVGRPGTEILKAIDEDPAFDLVVMGSHGRTGLSRVFLGSVAEKVVRHARCPVLVARRRATAAS